MPLYTHDCSCCTYLGEHDGADLYLHGGGPLGGSYIARQSSEPADYQSIPIAFYSSVAGRMPWADAVHARATHQAPTDEAVQPRL